MDVASTVIDAVASIANNTRHYNVRVTLYEQTDGDRRFATIKLMNKDMTDTIKKYAGGYMEVFVCQGATSGIAKFAWDSA